MTKKNKLKILTFLFIGIAGIVMLFVDTRSLYFHYIKFKNTNQFEINNKTIKLNSDWVFYKEENNIIYLRSKPILDSFVSIETQLEQMSKEKYKNIELPIAGKREFQDFKYGEQEGFILKIKTKQDFVYAIFELNNNNSVFIFNGSEAGIENFQRVLKESF